VGSNVSRARILTMDTFCPYGPTRVNIYPAPNVWVGDPRRRHENEPGKCGQFPGSNSRIKKFRQSADTWTDDCLTERVNPRVTGVPMSPSTSLINDLSSEYTGERPRSMAHVVGEAASLVDVYRVIDRVAATPCTILCTGESGTGKELIARAIHETSPRASKPFVAVNCGAIPEALLESELFGHMRGAFTGAIATKPGKVTIAQGGTLFLDELGELPLALQVKLLRLLQNKEYSPVGDTKVHKADVRIVAATNVDLETAVRAGQFREDLYYRLNVIHLQLPPLRERPGDVPRLADFFLAVHSERLGRSGLSFSKAAIAALEAWQWPGNVRELENTVERAVLLGMGPSIEARDLPSKLLTNGAVERRAPAVSGPAPIPSQLPDAGVDLRNAVEVFENDLIKQALSRTGWNKNQAARLLGLNRTTLVEMLKRKGMADDKVA
jgi:transcriptional regulator with GAF, ATPase, and Fis domain